MKNIWILLIWETFVVVEAVLYSICTYYLSGPHCEPTHISDTLESFFEYFDRFVNYQSWFIPLLWLYWPT